MRGMTRAIIKGLRGVMGSIIKGTRGIIINNYMFGIAIRGWRGMIITILKGMLDVISFLMSYKPGMSSILNNERPCVPRSALLPQVCVA